MALPSTTILEVQSGAGASDTLNGGGFDTASTGKPTDLTCTAGTGNTATPEVSSASYNFVSPGDVNNWLYIQAGTNWIAGWYKITSVTSNKATVDAAIGHAILFGGTPNTAAGVATVGTPTAGTWAVDYSQQAAAQFALTSLTTSAANAIILTSAATKAMVGNLLIVKAGTNFTAGTYSIIAASAGVSLTVDRNCATAAGSAGTAGIGGALASPGQASALLVGAATLYIKQSSTYTLTSATANVAGGCMSLPAGTTASPTQVIGYNALRGDGGTKPLLQAGSITTFVILTLPASGNCHIENLSLDGVVKTSSRGITANGSSVLSRIYRCKIANCTNSAIVGGGTVVAILCEVTGCTTSNCLSALNLYGCSIHDNTFTALSVGSGTTIAYCEFANNTGATTDAILVSATTYCTIINCTIYASGRDGVRVTAGAANVTVINTIVENNVGTGFNATAAMGNLFLYNSGGFNNTSGLVNSAVIAANQQVGLITATAEIFNAPGSNDFSLNNNSEGGALFRAAGIPGSSASLQLPGLSTLSYPDIGAVQHPDPFLGHIIKVASIGTY